MLAVVEVLDLVALQSRIAAVSGGVVVALGEGRVSDAPALMERLEGSVAELRSVVGGPEPCVDLFGVLPPERDVAGRMLCSVCGFPVPVGEPRVAFHARRSSPGMWRRDAEPAEYAGDSFGLRRAHWSCAEGWPAFRHFGPLRSAVPPC